MPFISSTLTCQVDGLVKVYTYNENVYFAFEKEEQLNRAKEEVIRLWDRTDCASFRFSSHKKPTKQKNPLELLFSYPKEAKFSFGVSTRSAIEGGPLIGSTEELIKRVVGIINFGTSDRTVPIEKIKNPEEFRYRRIF